MSDTVITLDPPDLLFPFRPDGDGNAEQFSWRRFRWEPLIGTLDNYGYHVATWTPRDENREPLPRRFKKVHAIVWEVHNGPVPAGLEIDHIDGNKSNSHLSNLRLVTHAQNLAYARERLGNWSPCKLTPEQRAYVISLPSNHNWAKLSRELGVHKVTLLNIRCKAKKEAQRV